MSMFIRRLGVWIECRTGLPGHLKAVFQEQIPRSAGWPQAFGSVALFLSFVQALTGVLLSLNFSGSLGDSYVSLTYILRQVPMGRMMHGLHHWGASLMLIATVLHAAQVFIYGAYKKPREATWICGVLLLLTILGFSLTGYLLPWDNRAYWGTVVTIQILGQTPIVGPYLQAFAGASDGIGVVAFTRFYALHTIILPAATTGLIALHLFLVRRNGVAAMPEETPSAVSFYPGQVFKDVVACSVAFALLFTAASFLNAPLERLADPTDTAYVPRPEWYFLFLFEILKFFQGSLEPVGSIILPTLVICLLFSTPFLDRGRANRLRRRGVAISIVCFGAAAWSVLTVAALKSTPAPASREPFKEEAGSANMPLSPEELAGLGYFRSEHCETCHNLLEGQPKVGPTLALQRTSRSAGWLIQHFKNPSLTIPGSNMPPIHLDTASLNALSSFLLKATPENATEIMRAPATLVTGAQVYVRSSCGGCHKVNDVGGSLGPKLNGLGSRRNREWIAKHFDNPQALSPGSTMPPFHFSRAQESSLIDYLLSLP